MKLKLQITMDNAAFEDNQGGEVARILRGLADRLNENQHLGGLHTILLDINGNAVGEAKVTR